MSATMNNSDEPRPFRVGDRVVTGDGNGEQVIARVITEPERMYSDDSGHRVRVEFQVASTVTRTPLVSHVRHAEHADEIYIFTREWIVTGENILDDPDEYGDVLFVRNDDVTHIIRAWLAANGYADFRALADVMAENERLRAESAASPSLSAPDFPPGSDEPPANVLTVQCVRTGTVWGRLTKTWCDQAIWTDGRNETTWYHLNKIDPMSEGFQTQVAAHVHTEACLCVMVSMDVEGASECHYCGVHGQYRQPCGSRCDVARTEVIARG